MRSIDFSLFFMAMCYVFVLEGCEFRFLSITYRPYDLLSRSVLIFVVKGGVFFCFLLHKNKLYSLLTILVFMAIFCAFFVKGW